MLRHMEIPKKVMRLQHETLKKSYPTSLTSCPLCNCNLLHSDGFYHFEHVHYLVSALFYLLSDDAKVYGDKISTELISVVRKVLPKSMKHHLSTFLEFQLSKNKIYQSQAKKNQESKLSSATAVSKSKNPGDELDIHNEDILVIQPSGRPQVPQHRQNEQKQPRGRPKGSKNKPKDERILINKTPKKKFPSFGNIHHQPPQIAPKSHQTPTVRTTPSPPTPGPGLSFGLAPLAPSMAEIAKEPIRSSTLSGSDSECEPLEELNNVAELDPPSPDDIFVVDKVLTSQGGDSSQPKTRFEAEFSNFLSKTDA